MRNVNGLCVHTNNNLKSTSVDTRQVSENSSSLTPAQIEFIGYVTFHGIEES